MGRCEDQYWILPVFDFVGEVEEAVSAADAAIIITSGKAGVRVAPRSLELCDRYKLPRMVFVTDMDIDSKPPIVRWWKT